MIHARRARTVDPEVVERRPPPERHRRVNERHLDAVLQGLLLLLRQLGTKVWNHHVPAREHDALRTDAVDLFLACVRDLDIARPLGANPDGRAAEADADWRRSAIELAVIDFRENAVLGGPARQRFRDQCTNEQPGD